MRRRRARGGCDQTATGIDNRHRQCPEAARRSGEQEEDDQGDDLADGRDREQITDLALGISGTAVIVVMMENTDRARGSGQKADRHEHHQETAWQGRDRGLQDAFHDVMHCITTTRKIKAALFVYL